MDHTKNLRLPLMTAGMMALSGVGSTLATAQPVPMDVLVAFQGFEGNSLTPGLVGTNAAGLGTTLAGTVFDSGAGLGWSVSFLQTRAGTTNTSPLSPPASDSDIVGVTNGAGPFLGAGSVDAGLIGSTTRTGNVFYAEDSDGSVVVTFAAINTAGAGLIGLSLSLDFAAANTGYEGTSGDVDLFEVLVNGESVFRRAGEDIEGSEFIGAFASTGAIDLTRFLGGPIVIAVLLDNSTGAEDFAFDNIELRGLQIPGPGGLGAMALAGLLTGRRRR